MEYIECILFRNLWVNFYDFYHDLDFLKDTISLQSLDADGFGVCFDMGKKHEKVFLDACTREHSLTS